MLEKGEDILINNVKKRAIISNTRQKVSFYDDKFIRVSKDTELKTGDLVDYQNKKWLIISEIEEGKKSCKGKIRKASFAIKFILANDVLHELDTVVESINNKLNIESTITLDHSKIIIIMQDNTITQQIKEEMRFIFCRKAYVIENIDFTESGLIKLVCKVDPISSYDDRINEIANRWIVRNGIKVDRLPYLDNQEPPVDETPPEEPNPEVPIDPPTEPEVPILNTIYTYDVEMEIAEDIETEIWSDSTYRYTIHKFVDGVEVVGNFDSITSDTYYAITRKTSDNTFDLVAQRVAMAGDIVVAVTDLETNETAIEIKIRVMR